MVEKRQKSRIIVKSLKMKKKIIRKPVFTEKIYKRKISKDI